MENEHNVYDQTSKESLNGLSVRFKDIDTNVCHNIDKIFLNLNTLTLKTFPTRMFSFKKSIGNKKSNIKQCSYKTCFGSQAIRC